MKNLIYKILFIVFFISNVTFSADELYRSKTSGNWNNPSTWEFSVDGTNWFAATSTFPDISSGETQIRNGHNVTVPASTQLSINQFAIRTGGTVTINAGASLTITDQSSSDLFMESGSTMTGNGGIVKTYGPNVQMILRTGCIFNSPLKIDTLISTIVNDDGDLTAVLKGPVEIDTGSTLAVQGGGFRIRFDSTLRNLGNIIGSGSSVDFYGYSMVNYGNISVTNFNYYDSSVVVSDSINKAGKFTSQNINIQPSGRVRHNGNSWTIGPSALTMNIISGGKLDVSNTNFILDGTAGTIQFNLDANSRVVYTGSTYPFQTKGSVNLNLRTGSIFNAGLRVLSGTTVCYSDVSPLIGEIFSPVTINAAAVMSVNPGGYGTRAYNTVINNGEISGSGSYFFMRGNSFANNGKVSTAHFYFDTTTSLSGTGTWACSNINIRSSGKVNIANNLSFGASSAVNINIDGGGVLNPNTRTLTLNGTSGTVNLAVFNLGTISNSGIFQTQGTVNFELKTGCVFGAPFKVNSGTCNVYNSNSPIIAVFNNTITIDAGSNLNVGAGGFGINSKSAVINNGTISGSASNFYLNGNSIANNGTINVTNFYFDDTTSIFGNGSWVSQNITARNSSMITLSNNLTFGPSVSTVTLQPSCSINPNDFILTLIGNPGLTFTMQSGSGLKNSGIVKTQQAVNLDLQTGCSFDTPLNVNTGTANAYSSVSPLTATFYNTITIETNSILNVRDGGFGLDSKNTLTNNGTISGPGSHFFMNGNSIVNNGTINVTNFYFDDTTSISGNGSWVSQNIVVRNLSLVTLSNNLTFGPSVSTISLQPSCTINPNGFVFTLIGNPGLTFTMQNGSVVKNPGTFKTQQSVNLDLQTGCNFNIPLHVNTGLTNAYSTLSPITAIINGTILTDSGATLNVANGGYILVANENVTNNGIISGSSSSFIFWSQNFINNGIVSVTNFYFKGIPFSPTYSHTLQGTGIFSGGNCVIEDGAFVVMNDNHQFSYLTINTGGTFDITSKTVKLSGAGVPIAVSGFLLTPGSTIEYNGIAPQTLISSNIAYENLIINDSAGVTCSDNFSIPGTLQIIKGDLDLNGKIINLLTNGILTETPGNTVKGNSGYLVVTRN
ncbi:MAG: hypothetical protein IPL53_03735 [Ignavibacteria bacterium]|nr:hypothetical protein [Ignavibacteria bacterium]